MKTFLKIFKGSSLLNILGMTAAFASLYILLVQVNYDLGYNKKIKELEKIYVVTGQSWFTPGKYSVNLNRPLQKAVLDQSPTVEVYGVADLAGSYPEVKVGEGEAERSFKLRFSQFTLGAIKLFGYEPLQGSFDGMDKERLVAISESAAKLMGVTVGDGVKFADINGGKPLQVAAIYKDMPMNSDLDIDILYAANYEIQSLDNWNEWSYHHFVKLHSPEDKAAFEENALPVIQKTVVDYFAPHMESQNIKDEDVQEYVNRNALTLIPFSTLYFGKEIDAPPGRSGNKITTYTLLAVALLIVIITLINFVNFFFAQVPTRIRAVNTRKILGSSRAALVGHFMLEAGILVLVSMLFAAAVVVLFKSSTYANLINCSLGFGDNPFVLALTFIAAMIMTVGASVYPAMYITSFSPAFAIKGSFGMTQKGKTLRYTLIGLQFVISIAFVICAWFIKLQHTYMMNYDMGFNKECLMTVNSVPFQNGQKEAFESELLANPQIKECAWAHMELVRGGRMGWGRGFKGEKINFESYPVSYNFLDFMGIDVVEGRNFTKSDEQCENGVFIFNQSAKEKFGFTLEDRLKGHAAETDIVGFCEDFQFKPLQYDISPFAFYVFGKNGWWEPRHLYFRTTENADIKDVIQYVRETIVKFAPKYTPADFEVEFFDQELGDQYQKEQQLTKMVTLFTILAIVISLMGVLGLVIFETQYRRKEIGVRRVHGATVGGILQMFNLRFAKILLVCMLVAAPISWYIIDYYYSSYVYRSPMYWWVFVVSFVAVAFIVSAVVTVCSWKAATENPVTSLRSE